jgi:Flp pilus assembly protein TadB
MVPVMSLWLPIVLAAVIVFFMSFVFHMLLPFHRGDMKKLPSEAEALEALRKFNIPPGDYMFPFCASPKEMKDPAWAEKRNKGPVGIITVLPSGPPAMGKSLVQWFIYSLVVGVFAAYVTGRAVGPGTQYLLVFRYAGCTAFLGYSLALCHDSIWYGRSWGTTFKYLFDGLVYGLLTAGTFGWLWPK